MKPVLVCLLLSMGMRGLAAEPAAPAPDGRPRLAVVISIDQCRADYLERFRPYFVTGGFRRLLDQGADFRNAHHRHAFTATAPGHATILTGVSANQHGIIGNEWFDPAAGRVLGSVDDPAAPAIGAAPKAGVMPGSWDAEINGSPRRLLAATVGDQLKLRHGAASRVIALANKDRAAIFLGGRLADAAYWIVDGRVVTSRYYRARLPAWVESFNAEDRAQRSFGHTWDRLLAPEIYDAVQGPDDAPGEESINGLGTTFPRRIDGGEPAPGPKFQAAFRFDPECSVLLGAAIQRAVTAEQLGRHAAPDLLGVGFSQLDYVGHSFGPDSHEVMDVLLRLDRVIAELLTCLDREVGEGRYVVVLTTDHGVAPLPERTAAFGRGVNTGRMDYPKLNHEIDAAMTAAFGAPANAAAWALRDVSGYRLTPAVLAERHVASSDAQRVLKETLLRSSQIGIVWTRDELLGKVPAMGPFLEDWRLSFNAERSPDVMFSPAPFVVDRPIGTNHGTPYDYDNHVPLVWFGAGVPAGVHVERVGTDAIAPTLAALLGVPAPPLARAERLF